MRSFKRRRNNPQSDSKMYALVLSSCPSLSSTLARLIKMWMLLHHYLNLVVLDNKDAKLEFSFNAKAMNAILSGLAEEEFVKVIHLETNKEMWDKLISNYEGNEKVKDAKLQTYRVQFEQLKMKEEETIGKYFLRVEEMVNAMKALGEKIEEPSLV
jgi:hypothetical protein